MGDHSEQPVTADRQREELLILAPTAVQRTTFGIDDPEGFDVGDERRKAEAPAMNVRGQRSAD